MCIPYIRKTSLIYHRKKEPQWATNIKILLLCINLTTSIKIILCFDNMLGMSVNRRRTYF